MLHVNSAIISPRANKLFTLVVYLLLSLGLQPWNLFCLHYSYFLVNRKPPPICMRVNSPTSFSVSLISEKNLPRLAQSYLSKMPGRGQVHGAAAQRQTAAGSDLGAAPRAGNASGAGRCPPQTDPRRRRSREQGAAIGPRRCFSGVDAMIFQ